MALVIGIGDPARVGHLLPGEPSLQFEDEALYWALHPLLETLRTATGQYVDLYGGARFSTPEDLDALDAFLAAARDRLADQPEEWDEHVGTQTHPEHRELFTRVRKSELGALLQQWGHISRRARQRGLAVDCCGD
jgi:hypothetical protein